MTANATNAVWGSPLFQTRHLEGSYDSSTVRPIGRQLRTFVGEQIERFHPEIIIVVERKGTAILRALTERASDPLRWSWTRVLSSSVVGQLPDDFFKTKRILIFDDMMRTGKHLTEVLDQLWERRLWELTDNNVKVAVFAVHERGFKSSLSMAKGFLIHGFTETCLLLLIRKLGRRSLKCCRPQVH